MHLFWTQNTGSGISCVRHRRSYDADQVCAYESTCARTKIDRGVEQDGSQLSTPRWSGNRGVRAETVSMWGCVIWTSWSLFRRNLYNGGYFLSVYVLSNTGCLYSDLWSVRRTWRGNGAIGLPYPLRIRCRRYEDYVYTPHDYVLLINSRVRLVEVELTRVTCQCYNAIIGWIRKDGERTESMQPLLDEILESIPPPKGEFDAPFSMLVTTIG